MRDIEKDLELCEAASKGPWKVKTNRHRNTDGTSWGWVEGTRENWCWSKSRNKSYEDAAFIAAARTALPYWLGEVKRLRELTDALGDEVLGANADLAKANIALRTENERLREALDLACEDIADDSCPAAIIDAAEFSGWDECAECPAQEGEIHVDTDRDIACWKRYYLEKAGVADG
jgi:hypothetical protein